MINRILQTKESMEFDILSDIEYSDIFLFIIDSLKHETKTPYSVITQSILHYNLSEPEAKKIWLDILKNKDDMEAALNRKVSIKTALVDYYTRERRNEEIIIFIKDNMIDAFESAMRDGLTGLFSHALIHAELEKEFQSAKRYNLDLSVIFIDIDDFKMFNDTHGHIAGDRALSIVSESLLKSLRTTDKIGRYGGEEFLIVLPHIKKDNAVKIANKLRKSIIEDTSNCKNIPNGLTVSMGVSCLTDNIKDGHDLIKNADICLYRAKKEGKNKVCF